MGVQYFLCPNSQIILGKFLAATELEELLFQIQSNADGGRKVRATTAHAPWEAGARPELHAALTPWPAFWRSCLQT